MVVRIGTEPKKPYFTSEKLNLVQLKLYCSDRKMIKINQFLRRSEGVNVEPGFSEKLTSNNNPILDLFNGEKLSNFMKETSNAGEKEVKIN